MESCASRSLCHEIELTVAQAVKGSRCINPSPDESWMQPEMGSYREGEPQRRRKLRTALPWPWP